MDAKELKPCPFCGGTAELKHLGEHFGASCANWKCQGMQGALMHRDAGSAVAAWNGRAALPSDAAQAPVAPPVAWMIDWPDEPELGHYFGEEPNSGARSMPLYASPAPLAAAGLTDEQIERALAAYTEALETDPRNSEANHNSPAWPRIAAAMHRDAMREALLSTTHGDKQS